MFKFPVILRKNAQVYGSIDLKNENDNLKDEIIDELRIRIKYLEQKISELGVEVPSIDANFVPQRPRINTSSELARLLELKSIQKVKDAKAILKS